jgi:hypothetical protein
MFSHLLQEGAAVRDRSLRNILKWNIMNVDGEVDAERYISFLGFR